MEKNFSFDDAPLSLSKNDMSVIRLGLIYHSPIASDDIPLRNYAKKSFTSNRFVRFTENTS